MLSNNEFLDRLTASLDILDSALNSVCVVIKGLDSRTLYVTKTHNRVFNCDSSIINNFALPEEAENYQHSQSLEEEQKVISSRKKQLSFNIHFYDGKVQPYISNKFPIINPDTDEVIGVLCSFHKIPFSSIHHQLLRAFKIYKIATKSPDIEAFKLTKREKEAIFLFLSGLNSLEIAHILSEIEQKSVTKSTIDSLFAKQLRIKFGVYSRQGLFEKLMELGFDRYIPKDLFINIKLPIEDLISY